MSNFTRKTKHPITGEWEEANWIDKGHSYDVIFKDGRFPEKSIKEVKD